MEPETCTPAILLAFTVMLPLSSAPVVALTPAGQAMEKSSLRFRIPQIGDRGGPAKT